MGNYEEPVVDGTISEADPGPDAPPPQALALTPRPPAERQVLMPLDPQQVVEGMRQYQQLLRDLLEPSDWQTEDKNGRALDKPFLKKSGWRKISRAFNLSFELVHSRVERDEHGEPLRAEVWIRAVAPNGQYGDGDGYCDCSEARFQTGRGRQKLENDLRTTSTTRAKNRAIADLVGMGEVSAEEIEAGGSTPAHGPGCEQDLATRASRALSWLLDGDVEAAEQTWEQIRAAAGGYMPAVCAEAIVTIARARHERHAGDTPKAEPQGGETSAADGPAATPRANGQISDEAAEAALEQRTELDRGESSPADAGEPAQDTPSNAPDRDRTMVDEAMQIAAAVEDTRRHGYSVATVQALARLLHGGRGVEQLDVAELDKLRGALASAHAGATSDAKLREALAEAEQQPDRATAAEVVQRWLQTRARNRASKAA